MRVREEKSLFVFHISSNRAGMYISHEAYSGLIYLPKYLRNVAEYYFQHSLNVVN